MAGFLKGVGFAGLNFGPMVIDYGPKGNTTHFTVQCLQLTPLINYYNYIVSLGGSGNFEGCDVGVDNQTSAEVKKLHVSVPGIANELTGAIGEYFFDQWGMPTNETSDTIFVNPLIVGGADPVLDYNSLTVLSYLERNGGNITSAVLAANADLTTATPPGPLAPPPGYTQFGSNFDTAETQLALEIMKGQGSYEAPTHVLRHTSYCSPGSLYNTSVENEECIYPTTMLLTEISAGWTYNCPPRLISKVSAVGSSVNAPTPPPSESQFYTWGWLKRITREDSLANFMIEVSVEYELNLWSNLRYTAL